MSKKPKKRKQSYKQKFATNTCPIMKGRCIMFNKNRKNIKKIEAMMTGLIAKLDNPKLDPVERVETEGQLEVLIDYRTKMYDEPSQHPIWGAVVSGLFGLAGIVIILYYEKTDIITTKAFNIGTRMIGV